MRYRILGEFTMWNGPELVSLPAGTRLSVLGALLLNANRRMPASALMRAGWGRTDVGETQLHKSVSDLRALLERVGRREDLVTHSRFGYELRVAEDELDKLVFERLVHEAEEAGWAGRVEDEVALLREALRLWRGPRALAGLSTGSLRQDATDLEHRRKRAAVRLFELELAHGQHERILDEAAAMVSYHPSDRRLCEQLMVALYRGGHAAEAVEAYERYGAALEAATGAQPEASVRNLMYAIASADEAVIARYTEAIAQRSAGPARAVLPVPPRQLPPDPADFLGRDDPVGEARWLLTREPGTAVPVVVVCGPGGIGKTALAVHVAHLVRDRYPDGQLYVELRGTSDQPAETGDVLARLLRALGAAKVPDERAERVALYRSIAAEQRLLIVLDDAHDEAQVRDLVPGNPACGVLVTARRLLPDIDGVHHLPTLEPLSVEHAAELYARLVRRSGVDARTEQEATRRIVDLCAGLPLALCVAGALRARDQGGTGAELAERLAHQRPDAFVYNERSVARSIGAGLERLDGRARYLFLGLGLPQLPELGIWTAAAVLDGTGLDPAEGLLALAGRQLLHPAGRMRYTLHDLTRDYARRRAEADHPDPAARRDVQERVYTALLTLVRRAHRGIYGVDFEVVHSGVPDWAAPAGVLTEVDRAPLVWCDAERPNIRAAVAHTAELGMTELCWDLAVSAHEFYTIRGYHDDWYATHRTALAVCEKAGDRRGEAAVLTILGQPALVAGRGVGVSGADDLRRAADLFAACGDRHGEAIALRTLGNNLLRRGQRTAALAMFDHALPGYVDSGDTVGHAQTLRYMAQTRLEMGRPNEALDALHRAERVAGELSQPRLIAQIRYWIGRARLALGDLDGARSDFSYVRYLIGDAEDTGRAYAAFGLGDVARRAGHHQEAERYLREAAELAHDAQDATMEGRAYLSLAELYAGQSQPERRIRTLIRAVAALRGSDAGYQLATALAALGDAQADRGALTQARSAWTDADRLYTAMDLPEADTVRRKLTG